jgi:hypothetical protein
MVSFFRCEEWQTVFYCEGKSVGRAPSSPIDVNDCSDNDHENQNEENTRQADALRGSYRYAAFGQTDDLRARSFSTNHSNAESTRNLALAFLNSPSNPH